MGKAEGRAVGSQGTRLCLNPNPGSPWCHHSNEKPLDPGSLSDGISLMPLRWPNSVHVSFYVTLTITLNGQYWPIFQGWKWELRGIQRHVQGHTANILQREDWTPARAAPAPEGFPWHSLFQTPCFLFPVPCFLLVSIIPPPFLPTT